MPSTSSVCSAIFGPSSRRARAPNGSAGAHSTSRPLSISLNATVGAASASASTVSAMSAVSRAGDRRNSLRAGVLKNRFSTVIVVPSAAVAAVTSDLAPPVTTMRAALSSPRGRVRTSTRATAAMLGSASPRKP